MIHATYGNDNIASVALNAIEEHFENVLVFTFSGKQTRNSRKEKLIARSNLEGAINRVLNFYQKYQDDNPKILEDVLLFENYENEYKEILKNRLVYELPEVPPFSTLFEGINFKRLLLLYGRSESRITELVERYKTDFTTFDRIETHIINAIKPNY